MTEKTTANTTPMQTPAATGKTNTVLGSLVAAYDARLAKPWKVSDKGIEFMAVWESGVLNGKNWLGQVVTNGMILTVYLDTKGIPTVGCGHHVWPIDNLRVGDKISYERAVDLFKSDLNKAAIAINNKIKIPLHQYEYDAILDITYNAGEGGALDSLAKFINKGDYSKVPEFIQTFRIGGGNSKRRMSESNLFSSGTYDANH
jgi:lysozyme